MNGRTGASLYELGTVAMLVLLVVIVIGVLYARRK